MAHFDQPQHLTSKSARERRVWWEHCKRLQVDSLLCLVDSDGDSIFLSVCNREGYKEKDVTEPQYSDSLVQPVADGEQRTKPNLFANPNRVTITLRLIELGKQGFPRILGRDITSFTTRQILVEFPGVLLPSFQPTLEALQRMSKNIGDIPFTDLLLPRVEQEAATTAWPLYATQPGFAFRFDPIMKPGISEGNTLQLAQGTTFNMDALKDTTILDEAQCSALVGALSRNLALMQGPPGTGKSFVAVQMVKVLLNSRVKAEMNPIICV